LKTACNITSFLFEELSERQPKAPFLCCDGTVLTIEDFQTLVVRQCNIFSASGLIQGDAVLVATGRGNDFWIDVFALWRMGAIAVPIEAANNLEELRRIAQMSRARRLLCAAAQCEGLASLGLEMIDRSRLGVQPEVPATPLPAGATAMILFTSGSTGQPKGVVLSHGAILGNALSTRERIFLRPGDRLLFVIPFRFVSALSHVLVGLLAGTEVFGFERTLMQSDFCQLIARHGCTAYGGSPLQARWIAEFMEQSGSPERAFPHLRWLMSSGDYMREELAQRLMRQGLDVIIAYGLTEVAGRLCVRHVNRERSNTVGRPIRGLAVSYVPPATPNDSDRILAVQGEFLFDGYIGDPERSISANGERFFRTGDVGDINDDGSVSLSGRADDVFKVAGNKVSCLAIAAALLELETVKEVAVLARPYPVLGMAPHAYVVSRAGGEFDKGSALRHIRSALGSSHIPRSVTLVSRIPRTGSGKVDRRALVEMVETMKG
jgi:acyl-coenzyme A synthetase/AMP-(fatty) acid ligase